MKPTQKLKIPIAMHSSVPECLWVNQYLHTDPMITPMINRDQAIMSAELQDSYDCAKDVITSQPHCVVVWYGYINIIRLWSECRDLSTLMTHLWGRRSYHLSIEFQVGLWLKAWVCTFESKDLRWQAVIGGSLEMRSGLKMYSFGLWPKKSRSV